MNICSYLIFLVFAVVNTGTNILGYASEKPSQGSQGEAGGSMNIGVIGGGVGGSAAAYFLRTSWNSADLPLNITFVTDSTTGRTRNVEVAGQYFEEGGSVIHPKNKYMKEFVQLAAHSSELTGGDGNGFSGLVGKDGFFFFFTTNHTLEDDIRLFERYGLSLVKIRELVSSVLKRFDNIYNLQNNGQAFTTPAAMLAAMDAAGNFFNMTQMTGHEYLRAHGVSERAIYELAGTATRANYNQEPNDITAFATLVALAGSENGLFSVKGGNCLVAEGLKVLAKSSPPTGSHVVSIEKMTGARPSYTVKTSGDKEYRFDGLVVATPLQLSQVKFINFPDSPVVPACCNQYKTVFATFVKGSPNATFVGLPGNMSGLKYPDLVSPTPEANLPFVTIGRESPVSGEPVSGTPMWKVFSHQQLSNATLHAMFDSIEFVVGGDVGYLSKEWKAYPQYGTGPNDFLPFVLDDAVVYTSTIEWAASAMEMSAIAGRNAALLLHKALMS